MRKPCGHATYRRRCRPCHLARFDPRYRALWGVAGWGDVAAWFARRTGLAWLAWGFERATGRRCGCGGRREALNRLPPPGEVWARVGRLLGVSPDGPELNQRG